MQKLGLSSQTGSAVGASQTGSCRLFLLKFEAFFLVGSKVCREIVIEGQDKVFKDVIEPLENVSVNVFPTSKEDVHDLGSPRDVSEALIKRVLAPPSQKTQLIDAAEHDVDGKTYYTFEFVAKAPNFTRHALSAICIGNGPDDGASTRERKTDIWKPLNIQVNVTNRSKSSKSTFQEELHPNQNLPVVRRFCLFCLS
ncbi:hypothetical protein AgCh_038513 [Apium graveolens]